MIEIGMSISEAKRVTRYVILTLIIGDDSVISVSDCCCSVEW